MTSDIPAAASGESTQAQLTGESACRIAPITVLVPLDGSELAAKALPAAEAICAAMPESTLILLRALPITPLPYGLMAAPEYIPADVYQQITDDQERLSGEYLDAAAKAIANSETHVRTAQEHGDPASVILDTASQQDAHLIVMTTHGRTGLARFTMGSVADHVVRGGATPVLLLHSFETPEWSSATLRHALVPLDGSLLSEAPLAEIVPRLADAVIQQVTLLQVVDPRNGAEAVTRAKTYLAAARDRLIERLGDRVCAVETLVRAGPVARTILDTIDAVNCGVVIMSTRGAEGIGRLTMGGVTDHVLRDEKTPLLLVYPGG